MILGFTYDELDKANLLKPLFELRDWTPQSVEDSYNTSVPCRANKRRLIHYAFKIIQSDEDLASLDADTVQALLKCEYTYLEESECEKLGIKIIFPK